MPLPKITTPTYEIKLLSFDQPIKYRPFLVKEEKLLLMALESKDDQTMLSAIKTIIDNCVEGDKIDVDSLPLFDLEYWFLHLRANSVGSIIELKFPCEKESCEGLTDISFNINEVELQKDPNHTDIIKITDDISIKMKYPNVKQFAKFESDDKPTEKMFDLIIDCVESVIQGDQIFETRLQTKKELEEFVLSLNASQFKDVVNFFETMPKLQHLVTYNCVACNHDNFQVIKGVENFFLF